MVEELTLLILSYVSKHLYAEKSKLVQIHERGTEQVLRRHVEGMTLCCRLTFL